MAIGILDSTLVCDGREVVAVAGEDTHDAPLFVYPALHVKLSGTQFELTGHVRHEVAP